MSSYLQQRNSLLKLDWLVGWSWLLIAADTHIVSRSSQFIFSRRIRLYWFPQMFCHLHHHLRAMCFVVRYHHIHIAIPFKICPFPILTQSNTFRCKYSHKSCRPALCSAGTLDSCGTLCVTIHWYKDTVRSSWSDKFITIRSHGQLLSRLTWHYIWRPK